MRLRRQVAWYIKRWWCRPSSTMAPWRFTKSGLVTKHDRVWSDLPAHTIERLLHYCPPMTRPPRSPSFLLGASHRELFMVHWGTSRAQSIDLDHLLAPSVIVSNLLTSTAHGAFMLSTCLISPSAHSMFPRARISAESSPCWCTTHALIWSAYRL
jgi:hypothetical protein